MNQIQNAKSFIFSRIISKYLSSTKQTFQHKMFNTALNSTEYATDYNKVEFLLL